ncbi:serine hydrolase domain-containing protein [Actinocatenispora thailandica]|uniref:serine hydrolase domain-containing protein n=1 Tax=Actinocatenispora thailandica TaxID=227318 RepID=UPI003083FCBB
MPLSYQPGERWQYDLAHDLLGVLVARAAGQPFAEFLHERVLDPLGMAETGFHVPADSIDRLPSVYFPDGTGEFPVWDEAETGRWSKPPAFPSGAGGLVSTVDDYHSYFRMLLDHGSHRARADPVPARGGADDHQPPDPGAERRPYRAGPRQRAPQLRAGTARRLGLRDGGTPRPR